MNDEQVQRAALRLLARLTAQSEIEEWDNADSFAALTTNAETNDIHLNGPFPDVTTALAWADQHEHDLNVGMPPSEDPFVVTVFPMVKPS